VLLLVRVTRLHCGRIPCSPHALIPWLLLVRGTRLHCVTTATPWRPSPWRPPPGPWHLASLRYCGDVAALGYMLKWRASSWPRGPGFIGAKDGFAGSGKLAFLLVTLGPGFIAAGRPLEHDRQSANEQLLLVRGTRLHCGAGDRACMWGYEIGRIVSWTPGTFSWSRGARLHCGEGKLHGLSHSGGALPGPDP
jgi:hypothetical protein